jgi:hypothetical protein
MTTVAASKTKCSKKPGEYCRLHNPKGYVSKSDFFKVAAADPDAADLNKAVMTPAPIFDPIVRSEYLTAQAAYDERPENDEVYIAYVEKQREYDSSLSGIQELSEAHQLAKNTLWDAARAKGIEVADIHMHVYGYNSEPDAELVALQDKVDEVGDRLDEGIERRERIMKSYLHRMLEDEFPNRIDREHAEKIVLAHYIAEDEGLEIPEGTFSKMKNVSFNRKIRNIEECYFSVGSEKPADPKLLDGLEKMRKVRAKHSLSQGEKDAVYNLIFSKSFSIYG